MTFDYLVVGNSVLGLTTAYRLSQLAPNAKIAIVGPSARTSGATAAAGAMLGVFGEVTAATFTDEYDQNYFELSLQAQTLWPDFVSELNSQLDETDHVQIHPNGTFILLNTHGTSKDDTPNYQTILHALKKYDEPHTEVMPEEITGLCPEERSRSLSGVYIPNERSINPMAVLRALELVLQQKQHVTQIDATVSTLLTAEQNAHRIKGVALNNGDVYEASQVIIAAGVGSQDLIDSLPALKGRVPHIMSGDGVSFVFDQTLLGEHQIEHVIRTPNRAGACGLHVVPNAKNKHLLYLGAGNMMQCRPLPGASMESATWIMKSSLQEINKHLGDARLLKFNQGNRPTSIDSYPLFGASTSVEGLWFLTGTGRDGFQRSPLLSWHIAKKLTGETSLTEIEKKTLDIFDAFAPERLPLQSETQEEAMQRLQKEVYCALHETNGLLTTGLHAPFPDWLDRDIRHIYDQLDTDIALPPMAILPIVCRRWPVSTVKDYLDAAKQAWA